MSSLIQHAVQYAKANSSLQLPGPAIAPSFLYQLGPTCCPPRAELPAKPTATRGSPGRLGRGVLVLS